MVLILIGPMGCGKTTIGCLLAKKLGWKFEDADDFHPKTNIDKMKSGIPLTDADRYPWLEKLSQRASDAVKNKNNLILACSALKRKYRTRLKIDQKQIISVYLKGSFKLLSSRVANRQHEYMPNELLKSQLDTLEEPKEGLCIDIKPPPDAIVETIIRQL